MKALKANYVKYNGGQKQIKVGDCWFIIERLRLNGNLWEMQFQCVDNPKINFELGVRVNYYPEEKTFYGYFQRVYISTRRQMSTSISMSNTQRLHNRLQQYKQYFRGPRIHFKRNRPVPAPYKHKSINPETRPLSSLSELRSSSSCVSSVRASRYFPVVPTKPRRSMLDYHFLESADTPWQIDRSEPGGKRQMIRLKHLGRQEEVLLPLFTDAYLRMPRRLEIRTKLAHNEDFDSEEEVVINTQKLALKKVLEVIRKAPERLPPIDFN